MVCMGGRKMAYFSIIIPVYNVEEWLERCLDSILCDSCKDMELILVDDGSTDGSGRICDRYARFYKNVRVLHKENGGLSSARNAGLEKASGEWISFIDSDDWVEKDSFRKVRDLIESLPEGQPDMIKFGYKKIGGASEETVIPCVPEGLYGHEEVIRTLLPVAFGGGRISDSRMHTFVLSSCAHIYRHSFLKETGIRFISERKIGSEDFLFIFSLYMRAASVLVTHEAWYNYDTREGSLTQRYRKDLFARYRYLGYLVLREVKKEKLEKDLAHDFRVLYIGLMYICIMNECEGPGGRLAQSRQAGKILNDPVLQKCLRRCSFRDGKSRIIAGYMRAKAAFPLCMIQWRKQG